MQIMDSFEKTLILGKIEGQRRRGEDKVPSVERMMWLDCTTNSMDMSFSKLQEMVKDREPGVLQSMESQRVGHN